MNDSRFAKNVLTGFGGQLIAIVLGFIVPRIFITAYGSDVNGLLSTITQIFTYMALLEAGIGQAARNALYRPFQEQDQKEINNIYSAAKSYFQRFTAIYAAGVLALGLVLPLVLKTDVDYLTIFLFVLFEGMSGVISFYFIEAPSVILSVDGKSYINNNITLINKVLGYLIKIIMSFYGCNIVVLQLAYLLITIAVVFFYKLYFSRHYPWLRNTKADNGIKLKDRNSYIITEAASVVFNSTDMIVLSVFVSTQLASVYSVYNMIYSNVNLLLNSVYFSIVYILGLTYHEDIKKYAAVHDSFTTVFLGLMTVLMSVCYILVIPFITLYTSGISDIDYIHTELPLLFSLIQIMAWSIYAAGNLTGIAGYAKQTSYISLIEAVMNISLSIILFQKYGIVGVLLATVMSFPLKVIWCIYVADKKVLHRSYKKTLSIWGINYLLFGAVVLVSHFFKPTITSYGQFLIWGVVLTVSLGAVGMGLNFLVNRDCRKVINEYILKKRGA